jgi:hypothetical protein
MAEWRRRLPKARLIEVQWTKGYSYFAKFRLANAWRIQIGPVCVMTRAPWLEHVARVHHPELFA